MEEITEVIQDANILLEEKSEAIEVGLEIVRNHKPSHKSEKYHPSM